MASQEAERSADLGNRLLRLADGIFVTTIYLDEVSVQATKAHAVLELLNGLKSDSEEISQMLDRALSLDEAFAIDAYALLSIVLKNYEEGSESAESIIVEDEYHAFEIIVDTYRRAHEVANPAIQLLGARLLAKSLIAGKVLKEVPLTNRAQRVYEIILKHGPITGPSILEFLDDNSADGIHSLDQSTLTKEVIPELKRMRGVQNRRGVGYFDPEYQRRRNSNPSSH